MKVLRWANPSILVKEFMVTNISKEPWKKEINDNETRMWKTNMTIGIWNVRSLFWSGALIV